MKWQVTVDGKTQIFHNKWALINFMEQTNWWSINKVEVISVTIPLAQWELDLLNSNS